jgi:lysozyme
MTYSERLVSAIKELEGFTPVAKHLPGDRDEVVTYGFGETNGVKVGMTITEEQADKLLRLRLDYFAGCVNHFVTVPLTKGQFDAITDFCYNCGCGNFLHSTLLKHLNAGDYASACSELLDWDKANGKVLRGLERRRELEQSWFLEA